MCDDFQLIELSSYEKFFYYATLVGDTNVISISIISTNNNVKLNDETVKRAMLYMFKRHPLFRAHIKNNENVKKIYFAIPKNFIKKTQDMKFERLVVNNRDEFIKECENFNSTLFKYEDNCLLWKIKIVEFMDDDKKNKIGLLLLAPMYLTDGINIVTLSNELVNIINSLLENKECVEMNETLALYENIESMVERNGLISSKLRETYEEFCKTDPIIKFRLPKEFFNPNDHGVKLKLLALDKQLSKSLYEIAKTKKIKLNGVLAAVFLYALKDLYEENGLQIDKDLMFLVMINLRFRIEPKIDFSHTRLFVRSFYAKILHSNFGKFEDIWSDAKYINELIYNKIDNQHMYFSLLHDQYSKIVNSFNDTTDHSQVYKKLNDALACDFVFTNIGPHVSICKKLVDGPLKLEESYFGDSVTYDNSYISPFILHANSLNDQIMLELTTNRYRLNSIYADRYMQLFVKHIHRCISAS